MAVAVAAEASKVRNGAWWALASCFPMVMLTGTLYGFGEWSTTFKDPKTYGYDQERLEVLVSMSHLGNYLVVDSGVLVSKLGTPAVMALGCTYAGVGYLSLWLALVAFPGQCPLALLGFFCALYGHGCGTIDTAVFTQAMADFPSHRGNVVGCLKAWLGLAPATAGVIYEAVFRGEKATFLLFLGCYGLVCALFLAPVVGKTKGLVDEPPKRVRCKFNILVVALVTLALLFFWVQIHREDIDESQNGWTVVLATVAAAFAGLLLLPLSDASGHASLRPAVAPTPEEAEARALVAPPRNLSFWGMLSCVDFYIMMSVLVVSQGNGLMFISNAPQILEAYHGSVHGSPATSFVAVVAVFNSLGRLAFGNTSEWLSGRVHRTWFLVVSVVILFSAYAALVLEGSETMAWVAACLVGFGYGGLWGVQPPLMLELFGPPDYGVKYACSAFAAFIGSAIFNSAVAGPFYERAAEELGQAPLCLARRCFSPAFATAAAADVPALLLAVWLCRRSRWIYEGAAEDEEDSEGSSSDSSGSSGKASYILE